MLNQPVIPGAVVGRLLTNSRSAFLKVIEAMQWTERNCIISMKKEKYFCQPLLFKINTTIKV